MISKRLFLLIFLFLAFTSNALADNAGRAAYAIQHRTWPCKAFLNSVHHAKRLRISFLWNTFGQSNQCLERILKDPRLDLLQVSLVNDSCTRAGRCGDYELLRGMTISQVNRALSQQRPGFMARFRKYLKRAAEYLLPRMSESTECLITPFLESNLSGQAANVAIVTTREYFGRCQVGWSQVGNKLPPGIMGADYVEEHGAVKSSHALCVVNLDGESPLTRVEMLWFLEVNQGCKASFLWSGEDNCRADAKFIDPRKRKCKASKTWNILGRYLS